MVNPSFLNANYRISNHYNKNLNLDPKGPLVVQVVPSTNLAVQSVKKRKNKFHKYVTTTTISGGGLSLGVRSTTFAVDGDPVVFGALSTDLMLENCQLNVYSAGTVDGDAVSKIYVHGAKGKGLLLGIKYPNESVAANPDFVPDLVIQNPVEVSSSTPATSAEYTRTLWKLDIQV